MQHSQPQEGKASPSNRPETSSAKTLMDIGTRRIFNEDHDMFRESVRRFWTEEVVPYHKEYVLTVCNHLCLGLVFPTRVLFIKYQTIGN